MGWIDKSHSGITVYQCSELNDNRVIQAFSTKASGNMALHTGDDPARVIARRETWLKTLGLSLDRLVAGVQVHGTRVAVVGETAIGYGDRNFESALPETDALITKTPGIILATFTADCLPIFIYDPETPAAGIVHAGWRGTIDGIAGITVERMHQEFGTHPRNCLIAIGPSICSKCFRVEPELARRFEKAHPQTVASGQSGSYIDLQAFTRKELEKTGVASGNIFTAGTCTNCHPDRFFSYRADRGAIGRMMGIISLQSRFEDKKVKN